MSIRTVGLAAFLLVAAVSASAGTETVSFTTDEGTWVSLDADPGRRSR